jgi:hypothetical protein
MIANQSSTFLRRVLLVDALSCLAMGAGMLSFTGVLAEVLGLPAQLLTQAGAVLLPFAVFVGFLSSRERPSRVAVWIVIALNALWVVDSFVLLFSDAVAPNLPGQVFVIGQAAAVAVLAGLEYIGMRRSLVLAA